MKVRRADRDRYRIEITTGQPDSYAPCCWVVSGLAANFVRIKKERGMTKNDETPTKNTRYSWSSVSEKTGDDRTSVSETGTVKIP